MSNPYTTLDQNKFWRTGVAMRHMLDIDSLWAPKFNINPEDKVVTFGSCFAQHIGKALRRNGYSWHITEPFPDGLQDPSRFNYDIFSCRTGNIYTTSLLLQWVKWAILNETSPNEVWVNDNRYFDPFRPKIEINGFHSYEEMILSRQQSITAFASAIKSAKFFVFTLGLTESWINNESGYEYPMCPGTVAGDYDAKKHVFKNQLFGFILQNLFEAITIMRTVNSNLKFILTVSPVPLTATYSKNHVLVATMESKSILRAVAGQLAVSQGYIDYFPSYEIINSPVFRGVFFEPNQRSVNHTGVDFVMKSFFDCINTKSQCLGYLASGDKSISKDVTICEEELLAVFGEKK